MCSFKNNDKNHAKYSGKFFLFKNVSYICIVKLKKREPCTEIIFIRKEFT